MLSTPCGPHFASLALERGEAEPGRNLFHGNIKADMLQNLEKPAISVFVLQIGEKKHETGSGF